MPNATTLLAILATAIICMATYGYARASRPVGAAILLGVLGLIWGAWAMAAGWKPFASDPDPRIALRSSQWRCAQSHQVQTTALMPAGKALMPITTPHKVCDRYERR